MNVSSLVIGGRLGAAFFLAAIVAGCGGSGSANNTPISPGGTVVIAGGATSFSATSKNNITPNGLPQPVTISTPGSTTTSVAWVPAGVAVSAGQSLAIIPANTPLISGITNGYPSSATGVHAAQTTATGTVTINGNASGVTFTNGEFNYNIGLPAGVYSLAAEGPFTISYYDTHFVGTATLYVGEFNFKFSSNGNQVSLPTSIKGDIPSNGYTTQGTSVTCTFPSAFASGSTPAYLEIDDANGSIHQNSPVSTSATCTFYDLVNNDGKLSIPTTGVDLVSFSYAP